MTASPAIINTTSWCKGVCCGGSNQPFLISHSQCCRLSVMSAITQRVSYTLLLPLHSPNKGTFSAIIKAMRVSRLQWIRRSNTRIQQLFDERLSKHVESEEADER